MEAFEFLHRGLDYTVQHAHGPPDAVLRKLGVWMEAKGIDPADLDGLISESQVPPPIAAAIEHYGGPDALRQKLNRHVGGADLCWGLRDLALNEWGLMASAVLRSWGITCTRDFGRMVFALVENGLLHKQPQDRIEDFDNVYDFDMALDRDYKIHLQRPSARAGDRES